MRRKIHIDDLSLVQVERRLQRVKNPKEKIDVLLQYGKSIFAKDVNTSFQFLEKAFQLSEKIEYDFGLMKSAEYLAEYYNNVLGNLIEAEKYNLIAEQYAIKLNNKSSLSIALRTKGSILETRANYTEAESLILRALEIQQELGEDELSSVTLTELGYLYWKRGLYKKSRENFNNALVYFEKTQNVVKQAGVIHNIGVLFSEEGDYAQAIVQLEKSIALKERVNDTHGLSVSYHTLGTQYVHIQDLEKALQYFETSLQLKRQIKSERVFLTIGNMAYVYSVLEQYDLAIEYYNQAYTLAWNSGDKRNAADYKLYISTVLSKQGKVEESEATLESIKDLVEEISDPVAIVNLLQNLAGVAKRRKDYA
ncbi:MAG: tetratricopeptide repeat protein, partial [Candidatus Kapabacteria bacterium]|nr:tetratricopeptide repeat protein [Candidatus Kapabacteria bacterium]